MKRERAKSRIANGNECKFSFLAYLTVPIALLFAIPSHHYHLSELETGERFVFVDKYENESEGKMQIRQDNDGEKD